MGIPINSIITLASQTGQNQSKPVLTHQVRGNPRFLYYRTNVPNHPKPFVLISQVSRNFYRAAKRVSIGNLLLKRCSLKPFIMSENVRNAWNSQVLQNRAVFGGLERSLVRLRIFRKNIFCDRKHPAKTIKIKNKQKNEIASKKL